MTVKLQVGTRPVDTIRVFKEVASAAANLRTGMAGRPSGEIWAEYLRWAANSITVLRPHLSPADIDPMVLTKRYWSLQSADPSIQELITLLVSIELDERVAMFTAEATLLEAQSARWSKGRLIVLDTSAIIHGPKLWEWDPAADLG